MNAEQRDSNPAFTDLPPTRMVTVPLPMMELTLQKLRNPLVTHAQLQRLAEVLEVWVQLERDQPDQAQVPR